MKNFKLVISLFLLLPLFQITTQGQSASKTDAVVQDIETLFAGWPELYFSFQLADPADLHKLTKIISIDNIKEGTVYAYANKKEFSAFLKTGLD